MDSSLKILLGIIARSKTVPQLPEALSINENDYVFIYSNTLQQPVKIKKSNVLFPTDSFITVNDYASLPLVGDFTRLYLTNDSNKLYKWDLNLIDYVWLGEAGIETFLFEQPTPSATWVIPHNLGKYPSVTVIDSGNTVVVGEVIYTDLNNLIINFNGGFSGKASCN